MCDHDQRIAQQVRPRAVLDQPGFLHLIHPADIGREVKIGGRPGDDRPGKLARAGIADRHGLSRRRLPARREIVEAAFQRGGGEDDDLFGVQRRGKGQGKGRGRGDGLGMESSLVMFGETYPSVPPRRKRYFPLHISGGTRNIASSAAMSSRAADRAASTTRR